jgi:hypothetical protein
LLFFIKCLTLSILNFFYFAKKRQEKSDYCVESPFFLQKIPNPFLIMLVPIPRAFFTICTPVPTPPPTRVTQLFMTLDPMLQSSSIGLLGWKSCPSAFGSVRMLTISFPVLIISPTAPVAIQIVSVVRSFTVSTPACATS